MTISAIAGWLLITILVQSNGIFNQQNTKVSQGLSSNDAIDQIRAASRDAASVALGYPIQNPQYISNSSTVVLAVPSINASGNVIDNTYDYVIFTKDSTNLGILRKLVFPDSLSSRKSANRILTTSLSLFLVSYFDKTGNSTIPASSGSISVVLNQQEKMGLTNTQSSASAQINLRNN